MQAITVACVWVTGPGKYDVCDVVRLRNMVMANTPKDQPIDFVCLTDRPRALVDHNIPSIVITNRSLQGWWAKMFLFSSGWREGRPVVYFDLDTVICSSLQPLYEHVKASPNKLSICASLTKAVSASWPCKYGSCVMALGEDLPEDIWEDFQADSAVHMRKAGRYGDQWAIEMLYPDAILLQEALPKEYFIGYRDLYAFPDSPDGSAVVIYAGGKTPKTFGPTWVRSIWDQSSL